MRTTSIPIWTLIVQENFLVCICHPNSFETSADRLVNREVICVRIISNVLSCPVELLANKALRGIDHCREAVC